MLSNELEPSEMIEILRAGSVVRRYHCFDVTASENVGKHSYGAICFAFILCEGNPPLNLIKYLLLHDIVEQFVGDTPSPIKDYENATYNEVKGFEIKIQDKFGLSVELTLEEKAIAKACDVLDGIYYCIEEIRRGNKNFMPVFERWLDIYNGMDFRKFVNKEIIHNIEDDIIYMKMDLNVKFSEVDKRDSWRLFKRIMDRG